MEINSTNIHNIQNIVNDKPKRECLDKQENFNQSTENSFVSHPACRSYALSKIEIDKLENIQKTMQNVFMNPDISIGEAKIMLDRYKELEKIEDKNEYIKAVFEEAKRNYGFANSKIELKIQPPEYMDGYTGAADDAFLTVQIKDSIDRDNIINVIHHEFRHHKQKYWAYRYSPEQYMSALNKKIEITSNGKCKNAWKDVDKMINWLDENLGENTREKDFPTQYTTFAKKCLNAMRNYVGADENFDRYWSNFSEKDARNAGNAMWLLVKKL